MKFTCQYEPCSKEFESDNPKAMYHSASCRVMACRSKKKAPNAPLKGAGKVSKPKEKPKLTLQKKVTLKKAVPPPLNLESKKILNIKPLPKSTTPAKDPVGAVLAKLPSWKF